MLLGRVVQVLAENGYEIGNVDATVLAQRPKLAAHIPLMRDRLAAAMGVEPDQVSVKATTEEGLGFTGSGQGISSQAICLLTSPFNLALEDAASSKCQGCSGCRKA